MKIFAADIGGTNSRFALFSGGDDGLVKEWVVWLPTAESESLAALLARLFQSVAPGCLDHLDAIVFAVAGPVEDGGFCAPAYINWTIDIAQIRQAFHVSQVLLVNDFVAQAHACRSPAGLGAQKVLPGVPDHDAPVGIIGAGTGLGKALLIPLADGGFRALASEGGHAAFPFLQNEEGFFHAFLDGQAEGGYPTLCDVLSGRGLSALHHYLTGARLAAADVGRVLAENPGTGKHFARFFGRVCRDFALEALALGGIYVAGGIVARNPSLVCCEAFRDEFLSSATMGHILRRIPVFLMDDQDSGLWGAACLGRQSFCF